MEDNSDPFGLVGQTLAEKYAVERVVAKGGFGTVYYARHIDLQTGVAVKVLMVPDRFQGALRTEFLEKFRLEARTIAALAHAAIVRVLDYGSARFESGESPWMVLEWLEGRTLEADIEARTPGIGRSPRTSLELLRPAFDALSCAHAAGIAHRDIKPANMMIVRARRGEPGLRMLDFGIAKVMEADEQAGSGLTATQTELSAFSLFYAAPEQLGHARTGPWTDVHALALILVELLSGRRAYRAEDTMGAYSRILDRDRPTPGRCGVDVGPWEAVLERALAIRPADRFADADDLLVALESTVDAADDAWKSNSALQPLLEATAIPVGEARAEVVIAKPDTLIGSSAVKSPPPRSRWLVPVSVGVAISLATAGVYTAIRPDPPSRDDARPATRSPDRPVAEAVPAVTAITAPVVPAVPTPVPAPVPLPAIVADALPEHHERRVRRRREPAPATTAATRAAAPTSTPTPGIVIE